jgi:glycosyltransferase involved in cell wall biosynthesis
VMVRGDSILTTPRGVAKRLIKAAAYPSLLKIFDAALYVGSRSRAYYEHYDYPAERLFSSPHCVDAAWFRSRGTPEAGRALRAQLGIGRDRKVVLFAGRLLPLKRPFDALEACAHLKASGNEVSLLIAGAGELEAAVKQRAQELGVELHLLGFRNQSEMPPIYAAANVLVLPSERETWGLVCNEALACGTPIVVSDAVGCAPDLAADGAAGSVFPMGDVDSFASMLEARLAAPASEDAIRAKSERFGLDAAADGVCTAMAYLGRTSKKRAPRRTVLSSTART